MKTETKKLSLDDFKNKTRAIENNLSLIAGGILGACHCVTVTFEFRNVATGGVEGVAYQVCTN